MAKLTGPLLSLGARGQIAKTQVVAKWKGISYARQYVVPSNPNTSGQQETRGCFSFLSGMWKLMASAAQEPWNLAAIGQPKTNRNLFMGQNIAVLRSQTDISDFIGSPGAKGGLAPEAVTATGGSGEITMAVTAPALPDGWAIVQAVTIAKKTVDPNTSTDYSSAVATDTSTPYAPAFTGLAAGSYFTSTFFKFTKADGTVAFGPSLNAPATVT